MLRVIWRIIKTICLLTFIQVGKTNRISHPKAMTLFDDEPVMYTELQEDQSHNANRTITREEWTNVMLIKNIMDLVQCITHEDLPLSYVDQQKT